MSAALLELKELRLLGISPMRIHYSWAPWTSLYFALWGEGDPVQELLQKLLGAHLV